MLKKKFCTMDSFFVNRIANFLLKPYKQFTGREILRLILLAGVLQGTTSILLQILSAYSILQKYGDNPWKMVTAIILLQLTFCDATLTLYWLWKSQRDKPNPQRPLGILLIVQLIMIPAVFPFDTLMFIWSMENTMSNHYKIINISAKVITHYIRFYAVLLGISIYIRLKTEQLVQFAQAYNTYVSNEYSNLSTLKLNPTPHPSGPPPPPPLIRDTMKKDDDGIVLEIDKSPDSEDEMFRKYNKKSSIDDFILNPLDVVIDPSAILGEGQFGQVVEGKLRKMKVAVKVCKDASNPMELKMLLQEIHTLIRAGDHENIVRFHGITNGPLMESFAILLELCEMGDLHTFIVENRLQFDCKFRDYENISKKGPIYFATDLFRISKEIASGMAHLASEMIVHGDLAARNVLLTSGLKVKLSDFGMSRRLYNYQFYLLNKTQSILPWRWMSIEAIVDLKFSEQSDVWAFAVLLWEIFTFGEIPYNEKKWSPDIIQQLMEGERLPKPDGVPPQIYELMNQCWNIDAEKRPKFRDILLVLDKEFKLDH